MFHYVYKYMQITSRLKDVVNIQKMPGLFHWENLDPILFFLLILWWVIVLIMVPQATIEMDNQTRSNVLADCWMHSGHSGIGGKGSTRAGEGPVIRRCTNCHTADPSILGSPCSRGVLYPHLVWDWTSGHVGKSAVFALDIKDEDAIHYLKVRARKQKIIYN